MSAPGNSTAPPALPPQPVVAIDYDRESAATQAWAPLVKWLGFVAVFVSTASLASTLVEMLPAVTRSTFSFRSGPPPYGLIRWIPMALLLAGGIGCLTRWRAAPAILTTYVYAGMAVQVVFYFLIYGPRVWSPGPSGNLRGIIPFLVLGLVQSLGLPLLVLAVVRQPPVRRLFERR